MTVVGHSRHFDGLPVVSAFPPEVDIVTTGRHAAPVLRQNNPSGKISLNTSGKSALSARPVLSRLEGRSRVVTNAGKDAMDAAASARMFSQGEFLVSDSRRAGRTAPGPAKPFGEEAFG